MGVSRFSAGYRVVATGAILAALFVLVGSTAGFAANPESGADRCLGCADCENGRCDDGEGFSGHHHCCTTSCMSHTTFALPTVLSSGATVCIEPVSTYVPVTIVARTPNTPYRPPRA